LSEAIISAEDIQLGVRASQEGRYADAIDILIHIVESNSQVTSAVLYHLARSLFKSKKFLESVRYWEDLLKQHPDAVEIEMNLASARYMAAQAAAEKGQYRQASELLNKYCEAYPGDSTAKSIIPQLEKLADDVEDKAEEVRKHLVAATVHIEVERWSEAADEFLAVLELRT
jgi:tetratricopeptide (TPR) repeat protein